MRIINSTQEMYFTGIIYTVIRNTCVSKITKQYCIKRELKIHLTTVACH